MGESGIRCHMILGLLGIVADEFALSTAASQCRGFSYRDKYGFSTNHGVTKFPG